MEIELLPEKLSLRPSRLKWAGIFLIGAAFTAAGIMMLLDDGGVAPWLCILFFGAVAVVALLQMFGPSYLELDPDGFEQNMLGRKISCRWEDVSEFHVWSTQGNSLVGFSRYEDGEKTIEKVNRFISGGSCSLGDNFGMSSVELADLMNGFRIRALLQAEEN